MTKYLLRFCKKGNMRFLSHLDLNRLFRRAIKKAEIKVSYSNGYNPHEKINIIQPLSLGFTSDSEYFEITTEIEYDVSDICRMLNETMPLGIEFYDAKTVAVNSNYSNLCQYASYTAVIKGSSEDCDKLNIENFLNQDDIVVLKRDKKTKSMVEKSVKHMINSVSKNKLSENEYTVELTVRCAVNETLNPVNVLNALFIFSEMNYRSDEAIVNRNDLYIDNNGQMISLFEI